MEWKDLPEWIVNQFTDFRPDIVASSDKSNQYIGLNFVFKMRVIVRFYMRCCKTYYKQIISSITNVSIAELYMYSWHLVKKIANF